MPMSDETPAAGAENEPDQSKSEAPAFSQVHLTFDLKPGTRIRVTVESTAGPNGSRVVSILKASDDQPAGSATITVPLEGQEVSAPGLGGEEAVPESAAPVSSGFIEPGVDAAGMETAAVGAQASQPASLVRLKAWAESRKLTIPAVLFGASLVIYLLVRVIGLTSFPIYYSCDEAANPVAAADFLSNNLQDNYGEFLPTFFKNGGQYCISTSVYLQLLPVLIFGKSVFVDRLVVALVSLLGAVWIALILRDIFKLRYWWSGVLLLSVVPTWFLHSRTGFEYCLMGAFYAGFGYYYLLYRYRSPRYLYLALVMGALTFYSYTPAQIIMVVTGLALLILDWRYHWQQRSTGLRALGLLVLLALPLVRFMVNHPDEYVNRLKMYNSFWVADLPWTQKIGLYISTYLAGLNPFYWFFPNSKDIIRYVMQGYGHIALPMLPFATIGLVMVVRRLRQAENRLLVVMMLAAPTGGAMVGMNATRAITMVIPMVILTALGIFACLDWLAQKRRLSQAAGAGIMAAVLLAGNFAMLRDALVNGPTWSTNYGLSGMQFGAIQVFPAAYDYARQYPGTTVYVSPNWTFQGSVLLQFFLPASAPVRIGTADSYLTEVKEDIESTAFVFTPEDYNKMQASGKFKDLQPDRILKYPNGAPGFYFVRLHYRDDIQQIMAVESEKRRQLVEEDINLNGEPVKVRHSALDIGPITHLFDGDLDSLVKTTSANPLVVELEFPQPRPMSGLTAHVGGEPVRLTVALTIDGETRPISFAQEAGDVQGFKDVSIDFGGQRQVTKLHLELLDVLAPDPSNVHMWELTFR